MTDQCSAGRSPTPRPSCAPPQRRCGLGASPPTASRRSTRCFPDQRQRSAHRLHQLLASDHSPESVQRLEGQLELMRGGDLFRTVQLDLYEAIEAQGDTALVAKLSGIDPFELAREGGDPIQGRNVFENQGICLKCHTALRGGGDARPPLGSIARLRRDDELLESLLDPGARLSPATGSQPSRSWTAEWSRAARSARAPRT